MSLSDKLKFCVKAPPRAALQSKLEHQYEYIQKPFGAFGVFEPAYLRLAGIFATGPPRLERARFLLFAGDHGIAGVAADTQKASGGQILDLLQGLSIQQSILAQAGLRPTVAALAVDYPFESHHSYWLNRGSHFLQLKMAERSADFREYPALTSAQCLDAVFTGARLAQREHYKGADIQVLSSLGEAQDLSALVLAAALEDVPVAELLVDKSEREQIGRQIALYELEKALRRHPKSHDPLTLLTLFGGYEIAALCGAILQSAELQKPILIEGLPSLVAARLAMQLEPLVCEYCFLADSGVYSVMRRLAKAMRIPVLQQQGFHHCHSGIAAATALGTWKNVVEILNENLPAESWL